MKDMNDVFIEHNGVKVSVGDMQKYWRENPDPFFSDKHNKTVIENSIRRAELLRAKKKKQYGEQIAQRVDAAVGFAKFLDKHGSKDPNKDAIKYFGLKELGELQGRKVMAKLQDATSKGQKVWRLIERP